ncbi:MAG: hypothetical protein V1707_02155 [bacterium]
MTEIKNIATMEKKDEVWEEIIDFTKIKKGGVDIKKLLKQLHLKKHPNV